MADKTDLRVTGCSENLQIQLANIAKEKGMTKSAFVRSELIKLVDNHIANQNDKGVKK